MGVYLRIKFSVRVVVDYAVMRFSNYKIEYPRKNEKVRETILACSHVAKVESFEQKL